MSDAWTHLCLNVECDEAVCDQVVDGLEPLLSNKVLPVMVETEVSCLVPKPGWNGGRHLSFKIVKKQTGSLKLKSSRHLG